jgi:hypothetical protein
MNSSTKLPTLDAALTPTTIKSLLGTLGFSAEEENRNMRTLMIAIAKTRLTGEGKEVETELLDIQQNLQKYRELTKKLESLLNSNN